MYENPRLRLLVGRYGRHLMVGLAVLGVVSLALGGWFAVSTTATTVTDEVDQESVETTATDRAVVTRDNDLWETGTELRNKPVYLLNASPTVTVAAETAIEGADTASISHNWTLSVRATRDGESFWTNRTDLGTVQADATSLASDVEIDMLAVRERVFRAQEQVGTAGVVSVVLELTVEYETDRYADTKSQRAPMEVTGNAYRVGDGLAWEANHSRMTTRQVAEPHDSSYPVGLLLLGVVFGGAAVVISRLEPDEIDLDVAMDDLHRRQYSHWISPGTLPFDLDHEFVELESLENVVDVAIDTQERVVHDRRRDLFAVISENVVYYYSRGGNWTETAFPQLQRSGEGLPEDFEGLPGERPEESFGFPPSPDRDTDEPGPGSEDPDGDEWFDGETEEE